MEFFQDILQGNFGSPVEAYMRAIADNDVEMPDVSLLVSIYEIGLDEGQLQMALQVFFDAGISEELLSADVRVTALGLICATSENTAEIEAALLWHNVYYRLGLVKNNCMAVVSCSNGEETMELQSVEAILRTRELAGLADLQCIIYNNLPPF